MIGPFLKNVLFIKSKDNNDSFTKIFLFIILIFPYFFRSWCQIFQWNNIIYILFYVESKVFVFCNKEFLFLFLKIFDVKGSYRLTFRFDFEKEYKNDVVKGQNSEYLVFRILSKI